MQNCYTYLIGWSGLDRYYYGVRYGVKADPSELWVRYFTSSKFVKSYIDEHGTPDVIQIRREFGANPKAAKLWEDKVLKRLGVRNNERWINRTDNDRLKGYYTHKSWNAGLSKETCPKLKSVGDSISKSLRTKYREKKVPHPNIGLKHKQQTNKNNSFRQLSVKGKFENYDEFSNEVYSMWTSRRKTGIFTIAEELGVDEKTIINTLKRRGLKPESNQSWTKILKRHPDFPFDSYEEFCAECLKLINSGIKSYRIEKMFQLSYCTIQRAIKAAREIEEG